MKPKIHEAVFVEPGPQPSEPADQDQGAVSNILDGADDFVSILPEGLATEAKQTIQRVRKAQQGGKKSLVGIAQLCQILSDKVNSSIKLPKSRPR